MSTTAMNRAISAAQLATHNKWRLGSVIVKGGSILGVGHNRSRNDPTVIEDEKYFECSTHAEVSAIKSTKNPKGAKLFVARLTPADNLALAKPCSRCFQAIKQAGIKKIYYTTSDGSWIAKKI